MDNKFTKEELVMLLAQRHQMEEADAEAFVEAFFALIKGFRVMRIPDLLLSMMKLQPKH